MVPEVLANTENTRKQKHRAILDVRKVGVVLRKPPKHRTYSSESNEEDGGDVKAGSREALRKGAVEGRQVQRAQRKIPWRRAWQPTPVLLPGETHGQRSLVGCNPWGRKELDSTESLSNRQSN